MLLNLGEMTRAFLTVVGLGVALAFSSLAAAGEDPVYSTIAQRLGDFRAARRAKLAQWRSHDEATRLPIGVRHALGRSTWRGLLGRASRVFLEIASSVAVLCDGEKSQRRSSIEKSSPVLGPPISAELLSAISKGGAATGSMAETAALFGGKQRPKLSMRGVRPRAIVKEEGASAALADEIARWLNDPERLAESFHPLPLEFTDASSALTRGLAGTTERLPGKTLHFSGVGVVSARSRAGGIDRDAAELIVTPPEPDRSVAAVAGVPPMGTTYVASNGSIWSVDNRSSLGAYDMRDLRQKVAKTKRWGKRDIEIIAAGKYRGSRSGWIAFARPIDLVTPTQVFERDQREGRNGELYGPVLRALFRRVRENHERKVAHLQLHPGNWFIRHEQGRIQILLGDWETATYLKKLPSERTLRAAGGKRRSSYERQVADLDPAARARYVDLMVAISASSAPGARQYSVNRSSLFKHKLRMAVEAMAGYHGWDLSPALQKAMTKTLGKRFRELALSAMEVSGGRKLSSFEALANEGRAGDFAKVDALCEIQARLAKASVSQSSAELLRDLRAEAQVLAGPMQLLRGKGD